MAALADAVDAIAKLEADLAEARAQIADQNDALVEAANLRTELRAQIAAKDAALERIVNATGAEAKRNVDEMLELRAQIAAKEEALRDMMAFILDNGLWAKWMDALAAPARETK